MCIRDSQQIGPRHDVSSTAGAETFDHFFQNANVQLHGFRPVSYTHLRAHETVLDLVCRLLLEKKKHALCNNLSFSMINNEHHTNVRAYEHVTLS